MTAHLVWLWHHGDMPTGILRHANGVNSDDRIGNLELLKKQLPIAYVAADVEVNEYGRLPEDIKSGIYEILCTVNGRRYIGSAVDLAKRWREHYTQLNGGKHHSRHLQRAWDKHGESAFVFRVLGEVGRDELIAKEQEAIDSLKPEFNSRPKAASQLGFKHSAESRRRMSESRPAGFSPFTGKSHSDASRAKISRAKTGHTYGPYDRSRVDRAAAAARASKGALTEDRAREVKRLTATGCRHREVAEAVGCSYWAVADIARGRTFAWVA